VSAPPAIEVAHSNTGHSAVIRVSRAMRQRLAAALSSATGMSFRDARAIIAQRAGDPVEEIEAWLRATYRIDPTGVKAVRQADRGVQC